MIVPTDDEIKKGLDFILKHFLAFTFPRTISTKTTEGRQIFVNDRAEALARFKQSNYLDCRINAYSQHDIREDPNFIFIDIDSTNKKTIDKILKGKFQSIQANPSVLFTGGGYHIYQPIDSVRLEEFAEFSNFSLGEPSRQFLKFSEIYLSDNKSDVNHNPTFKSCMVRIPSSINSKYGLQVKVVQSWDEKRPAIKLLLGSFYAWFITEEKKRQKKSPAFAGQINNSDKFQIKWIENNLLNTPLNDYRKTLVNLALAPYLVNIQHLSFEEASGIIQRWLDLCRTERPLDFNAKHLVGAALKAARKSQYKPMSLSKLKERNHSIYQVLVMRVRAGAIAS